MLNTITAPSTVRHMPIIHQRVTRNNNPFQILTNTNDDNDYNDTVVHVNCSPRAPFPDLLEPLLPTASPTPMPHPPMQRPGIFQKASPLLIPIPTVGPPKDTPAVTIHDIHLGCHKRARPFSMTAPPRYTIIEPYKDHPDQPTSLLSSDKLKNVVQR